MNGKAQNEAPISVALPVFSPRLFFLETRGVHYERKRAEKRINAEIPPVGVYLINPAASELVHEAWVGGLVTRARERLTFIDTVQRGALPTPLPSPASVSTPFSVHYIDPSSTHASHASVASLLEIIDDVVNAAQASDVVACPTCGDRCDVFEKPLHMVRKIQRACTSPNVTLSLHGDTEEIASWGESHGFTSQKEDASTSSIRLVSTQRADEQLLELIPLLQTTRSLASAWLSVKSTSALLEYSWHGRCRRCSHNIPPFQRHAAKSLIERGDLSMPGSEGHRDVGGVLLREALTLPLSDLFRIDFFTTLFSPRTHEWLSALSIDNVSLATQTTTLSPQALSGLILLAHSRSPEQKRLVRIVDLPLAVISPDKRAQVLAIASDIAHSSPLVWITQEAPSPASIPSIEAQPSHGTLLGTLHLSSHGSLVLKTGSLFEISLPATDASVRLSRTIHRILLGEHSPHGSFLPEHQCSPHLVPLFPREQMVTKLVAHELGLFEPLANLFASSQQARSLGISPRDFMIGQTRRSQGVCGECLGAGLVFREGEEISAQNAAPCPVCWGTRFRSPTREILFRGRALWELLNQSLGATEDTVRALPGMRKVVEICRQLDLGDIPLGLPVPLLSRAEARRLSIARAMLRATPRRPIVVIIEEPSVDCVTSAEGALPKVVTLPGFSDRVAWITVA